MKTSLLVAAVCLLMLPVPSAFALDLLLEDFSDGVIDDPNIVLAGDAVLGTRTGGEGGSALLRQLAEASGTGWGFGFTMDFEDAEVTDSDVLLIEYDAFSDAATNSQELYKVSVIVNGEGELGAGALELINVSHNKVGTGEFVGTTWGQVAAGGNSANAKFAGLANWDTTDGVTPEELDEVYRVRAAFRIGTFGDELFTNVEHLLVNSTGLVTFADVDLGQPRPTLLTSIGTNMLRPLDLGRVNDFAENAEEDNATIGFKSVRVALLSNTDVNLDGVTDAADRQIVSDNLGMEQAMLFDGDVDNDGDVDEDDLSMFSVLRGDYNNNGQIDLDDIDILTAQSASGDNLPQYDLTGDGLVNQADVTEWAKAKDIGYTWIGDANYDGQFDTGDFVQVLGIGKYEQPGATAVWSEGDWNGDGVFGTGDLVGALSDGGYEIGPRTDVAAVPEPSAIALSLLGLAGLIGLTRGRD